MIQIERIWAMPNKWTFRIPEIATLIKHYAGDGIGWADPFAGKSHYAEFRNDLNPDNAQPSQSEAADFLAAIAAASMRGIIFDPPYSLTQVSRSYEEMGYKFAGKENPTGGFPRVRAEIARVVQPGGICVSFGWNTCGIGKTRGFDIERIIVVCHGGNHNDTLITIERKMQAQLQFEQAA